MRDQAGTKSIVVPVAEIVPGVNTEGMASLEEIKLGIFPQPRVGRPFTSAAMPTLVGKLLGDTDGSLKKWLEPLSGQILVDLGCNDAKGYELAQAIIFFCKR